MDFNRNNLDKSLSPYLRQHEKNPVFWQEWSDEVLEHAENQGRLILLSSGYSTCHWCHVMAENTFSRDRVAVFLNEFFVCIKLDREERPDIDHFMMSFMTENYGQGGWPLNVLLSPDRKPFFAFTYAPADDFIRLLEHAMDFYRDNNNRLLGYMPGSSSLKYIPDSIIDDIYGYYDNINKGFKGMQKFPAHSTILFLLFHYLKYNDERSGRMAKETLEKMATSGLYDPVAGGFFRYCTDQGWNIPHFEKMMYDQAMHIMNYAVAYKVFGKKEFKVIAEKTLDYIDTQKDSSGLFYTALDADTDGMEGDTYLWQKEQLNDAGISADFSLIPFNGKFHLIKNTFNDTASIEKRLLDIRSRRIQPFRDEKILTSVNCLAGIALYHAGLALDNKRLTEQAGAVYRYYKKRWLEYGKLQNAEFHGEIQYTELLENYASFLVLSTCIDNDALIIKELRDMVLKFNKNDRWCSSLDTQLGDIPAQSFDHPVPSALSLAKMGIERAGLILEEPAGSDSYTAPYLSDYYNLAVFIRDHFAIIFTKEFIADLPLDFIQVIDDNYRLCHEGRCMAFDSKDKFKKYIYDHINMEKKHESGKIWREENP